MTTLNSVKQPDSYNCGVYVCWFMDIVMKYYQSVGVINIVQIQDLLQKDISNIETFRVFLEENDIDRLQEEPERNERIQLLQDYKHPSEQERRTRTRAVTPSKQRSAPPKPARKFEPQIEVVTSLSSLDRKKPNVITLTSSIHRFFPKRNVKWLRSHLKTSAKIMRYATLLARRFVVEYPHLAFALTHQHFWLACTDVFTTQNWSQNHKERRLVADGINSFQTDVYNALKNLYQNSSLISDEFKRGQPLHCHSCILGDLCKKLAVNFNVMIVSMYPTWKRNFLIACAREKDCSCPKTFATVYLNNLPVPKNLLVFWNHNIADIRSIYNTACGNPHIDELVSSAPVVMNDSDEDDGDDLKINVTPLFVHSVIYSCLSLLQYMKSNFNGNHYRLLRITPLSKYTPGFVLLSKHITGRMLTLVNSKEIPPGPFNGFKQKFDSMKVDPYVHFNKNPDVWKSYSVQSNGVQVMFTFMKKEKRVYSRRTNKQVAEEGRKDRPINVRPKKTNKRKPVVQSRPVFEGFPNALLVAIDPNHSNLCGYSYWYESMDHATSKIKLAPKGRARAPFNYLDTNISPNVCTAQDFEQYLQLVVGSGIHDDSCPLNHQLRQSSKISIRRHRFDFFIRRQRRYQELVNELITKSRQLNCEGVLVWYGRGTDFASRQTVKAGSKAFLKFLQSRLIVYNSHGDEYKTSKLTYCCKVPHNKTYVVNDQGERVVDQRHINCPNCNKNWHRDLSASLNQLWIFCNEIQGLDRPLEFQRGENVVEEVLEDVLEDEILI
ncbi:hypothetical protein RCL1_000147 [Eukaryota sp. TZLM3-RCL]